MEMRRKQEEVERMRLEEEDRLAALELQVIFCLISFQILDSQKTTESRKNPMKKFFSRFFI